jgi:exodeoxyribonuclease VII small subunit
MPQTPAAPPSPNDPPATFESLVSSLEAVVGRLERGDQPLEAALADYERGVALARDASGLLSRAELRLAQLTSEGAGPGGPRFGAEAPLETPPRAR